MMDSSRGTKLGHDVCRQEPTIRSDEDDSTKNMVVAVRAAALSYRCWDPIELPSRSVN